MELLIENTFFGEVNKEEIAIQRILEFHNKYAENENIVAFSGGKDSIVLKDLCKRAGIKCRFIYSQTSVDPPELIYYIRKHHPDVEIKPYDVFEDGTPVTMWNLIPRKLMPPTRLIRYCCDVLKERTGNDGDTVYLGVRWSESNKRSKLHMVGFWKGKTVVRPIIDWSDEDVWEYIHKYKLPYCELYDKGFKRIGCIGCPLNSSTQAKELEAYPQFKEAYIRAFERMITERHSKGKQCKWKDGQEVMTWWLSQAKKQENEGTQCSFME